MEQNHTLAFSDASAFEYDNDSELDQVAEQAQHGAPRSCNFNVSSSTSSEIDRKGERQSGSEDESGEEQSEEWSNLLLTTNEQRFGINKHTRSPQTLAPEEAEKYVIKSKVTLKALRQYHHGRTRFVPVETTSNQQGDEIEQQPGISRQNRKGDSDYDNSLEVVLKTSHSDLEFSNSASDTDAKEKESAPFWFLRMMLGSNATQFFLVALLCLTKQLLMAEKGSSQSYSVQISELVTLRVLILTACELSLFSEPNSFFTRKGKSSSKNPASHFFGYLDGQSQCDRVEGEDIIPAYRRRNLRRKGKIGGLILFVIAIQAIFTLFGLILLQVGLGLLPVTIFLLVVGVTQFLMAVFVKITDWCFHRDLDSTQMGWCEASATCCVLASVISFYFSGPMSYGDLDDVLIKPQRWPFPENMDSIDDQVAYFVGLTACLSASLCQCIVLGISRAHIVKDSHLPSILDAMYHKMCLIFAALLLGVSFIYDMVTNLKSNEKVSVPFVYKDLPESKRKETLILLAILCVLTILVRLLMNYLYSTQADAKQWSAEIHKENNSFFSGSNAQTLNLLALTGILFALVADLWYFKVRFTLKQLVSGGLTFVSVMMALVCKITCTYKDESWE